MRIGTAKCWFQRGLGTALLAVLFVAAPGSTASTTSELRTALNSDIRSTTPGTNRDENTDIVMMHLFEGLVAVREDGAPGLMLARSVEISADRKLYRFKLRPGLRFSNGAPVTAREVVWTWRRYLKPETNWFCLQSFDGTNGAKILSASISGKDQIDFRLDRPDAMFLTRMAGVECGGSAILHPASLHRDGSWRAPVATGPYRLVQWKRGEYIVLARNPHYKSLRGGTDGYAGGKFASVPLLRFYVIRDSSARIAGLLNGQLDLLVALSKTDARQLQRLSGMHIVDAPVAANNAILIQSNDPLMRDRRMRQALAMSIDLNAVADLSTGGRGTVNPSVVPAASAFHSPVHRLAYRHSPSRVRQLLAQAGYRGQELTLVTNRRYSDQFDQGLLVQSMARQSGINIKLEVVDWATELQHYQSGDYQLMSFAYSARSDPFSSYDAMLGDRRTAKRKVWGNPSAIALHREIGQTSDHIRRQELFDQMHKMMLKDIPLIVLFNPSDSNAMRPGVEGFRSWMLARARLWNVTKRETWR